MVRFVNSGTEATVTAIRIARGYTGRKYIVKFEGCYHGANDSLLVKAGSAASHYGISASQGIPNELSQLTYVLDYNDINSLVNLMKEKGENIAAIILEPAIANTGLILPDIEFLKTLREETEKYGSLLIFDEVVTGYRLSLGGAKQYYSINPDMITLGKIIGGGFPIGAVAANHEIMSVLTPLGKVFNAGTFNANPVSMVAGLATIEELEKGYPYRIANLGAEELAKTIRELLEEYKIDGYVSQIASMLQVFFVPRSVSRVKNASDAKKANKELYVKLHSLLLEKGVFIPPSQFETCFLSAGHNKDALEKTITAYNDVFGMLRE
jgi:glutamate-1-semialdehyde 2,1-aminomutase